MTTNVRRLCTSLKFDLSPSEGMDCFGVVAVAVAVAVGGCIVKVNVDHRPSCTLYFLFSLLPLPSSSTVSMMMAFDL